jgi:hypothetical protein
MERGMGILPESDQGKRKGSAQNEPALFVLLSSAMVLVCHIFYTTERNALSVARDLFRVQELRTSPQRCKDFARTAATDMAHGF